jgi:hypothetical protein
MSVPERVACDLPAAELGGRRERWLRLSNATLVGKAAIAAGVRLRFRWSDRTERELCELAALERECCSFAQWLVARSGDELTLEVTADGDGVGAVRAMFDTPPPTDPNSKSTEVDR